MLNEKWAMVLNSNKSLRGSLSDEEIIKLSDADAWNLINAKAHQKRSAEISVCFTGFQDDKKMELEALARSRGMVIKGVITTLKFLVCGENAGPAKRLKAQAFGTVILSEAEFSEMLSTGAIPEETTVLMPQVKEDDGRRIMLPPQVSRE
jgi:NAD-dependent DNA ligase